MTLYDLINGNVDKQDILNYYNANLTYTKLPKGIHGFVFQYFGIYNIFINKNLSYNKKKMTLLHELAHIELNQLNQSDKDLFALKINKYEDEADKYINFLLNSKE